MKTIVQAASGAPFRKYLSDEKGNLSAIFALTLVPLVSLVGIADQRGSGDNE